jgi:hypothetical protein
VHLQQFLVMKAERQVRAAVMVAAALGSLSLLVGLDTWDDRQYLDLETLFGLVDAGVVLLLAFLLARRSRWAAFVLVALACLGMVYSQWRGLPLLALVPNLVGLVFYGRASSALGFLRQSSTSPADEHPTDFLPVQPNSQRHHVGATPRPIGT